MVSRILAIVLVSCLLVFSAAASAQQPPGVLQLITLDIKPGGNAAFEEYIAGVRTAAQRLGLDDYWLVAQSVSGAPTYTVALERGSWAAVGAPGVLPRLAEALGEREAERLTGLAASSIASVHTAFYQPQPQLSNPRPDMEGAPDAIITFVLAINPNMGAQYAETAALTREAALAVAPGQHYIVNAPGFGAPGVLVVGFVEHWTELDSPRMQPGQMVLQHYGPVNGAAINARVQETLASVTTTIHRTRPDLSYQPAAE